MPTFLVAAAEPISVTVKGRSLLPFLSDDDTDSGGNTSGIS